MPPLTSKSEQQLRFTMRSGVLPALAVDSAAQLATTHCLNERTLEGVNAHLFSVHVDVFDRWIRALKPYFC